MNVVGKVLLLINALAIAGFVWLASMDYAKRNALNFQLLQEDFMQRGLPVDDKETDETGQAAAELIGKEMSKQLGTSVKAELEEVKQRHEQLHNEILNEPDTTKKKALLLDVLMPFTHTAQERVQLRQRIAAAKDAELAPEGALLGPDGPFEAAFRDAQGGGNLSNEQRRHVIAHALFCSSRKAEDFQRTLAVAGLNAYTREVEAETTKYRTMIPELEQAIAHERAGFVDEHRALVQDVMALLERYRRLLDGLERQKNQLALHQGMVTEREQNIKDLEAEIKTTHTAELASLGAQGNLEKALFEAQKRLAQLSEANQKLEGQIKSRETGRP